MAKLRSRIIFIHPGRLLNIDQTEYQSRLISALREIEAVTLTRFTISPTPRGIQFYTVNSEQMYKLSRRKDGKVPLGLRIGQRVYFLNDRDRYGSPSARIVEAVTIHEVGHVFNLKHVEDRTSIMHPHLTVNIMNLRDIALFQRRLGKP